MTEIRCNICGDILTPGTVQPHTVLCDLQRYDCSGTLTKIRNKGYDGWRVSIYEIYNPLSHIVSVEKSQNDLYDIYLGTERFAPNTSFIHFANMMAHLEMLLIGYASSS